MILRLLIQNMAMFNFKKCCQIACFYIIKLLLVGALSHENVKQNNRHFLESQIVKVTDPVTFENRSKITLT